ncbi:MAG TPA: DNA polymerase III subunit beta [bacterium]|nr:DNA polymerase III subunit beta [bacterium]HPT29477.1 DNA polymerase III subunit beta [bacterium]
MKFIGLQDNLKNALAIVSHVVSKNINLPILNNVLFKIDKGQIELSATNLEIGITHQMRGKVDAEGAFAVDSRVITDYINLLPSEKVEFEQKDNEIKIKCENYKTKIKIQPAQDFPLLPVVNKEKGFSVGMEDLKRALGQVVFAVSNSETRVELSGVLFWFSRDKITLVGTDSYRLAEKEIKAKANYDPGDLKVIVPSRTLLELVRVLSSIKPEDQLESGAEIKISLSENQILFSFGSTELVSRLISGNYPDYKQIIPGKFQSSVLLSRDEFVRAVKASAIFAKAGVNDINLTMKAKEKKLLISSASAQVGESSIELEGEFSGEDNDIIINYRYLLDGLSNVEGPRIKLELINGQTPCLIKSEANNQYIYIVMPIRQ